MGCADKCGEPRRRAWACPDLGLVREHSLIPVPGTDEEFPDCPAYYLRAAADGLPADHLIDGAVHPAELAGIRATEFKNGAISSDDLSPRMLEAALLYCREDAAAQRHETEQRRNNGPRR